MPMGESPKMYGTESDGSKSETYCGYCYRNGTFVSNITVEEMADRISVICSVMDPASERSDTKEDFLRFLRTLDRWNSKS